MGSIPIARSNRSNALSHQVCSAQTSNDAPQLTALVLPTSPGAPHALPLSPQNLPVVPMPPAEPALSVPTLKSIQPNITTARPSASN
ncbi:hypothetical protein [Xylella fastidiosa]|uniref:hypothetical protein n=1 Tax=Xylella fastidiosa TaxID=2371 RepID=UPI0012697C7B|nr:hypothetical protein [Xylella fastidiosa]